jgi:hypothetical protein
VYETIQIPCKPNQQPICKIQENDPSDSDFVKYIKPANNRTPIGRLVELIAEPQSNPWSCNYINNSIMQSYIYRIDCIDHWCVGGRDIKDIVDADLVETNKNEPQP